MNRLLAAVPLLLAAAPALAADPVAPSEFRAYAEGHTLYFSRDGKPFGSEAFEPGGATTWRYEEDGSCLPGVWRPYGAQLCFYYGGAADDILCWRLLRDEQGLIVKLLGEGDDAGMELRITGRDERKPICGEPAQPT